MAWNEAEHNAVVKTLAGVCEITSANLSETAKAIMLKHLANYPAAAIIAALERCAMECPFKLTLADVVNRIVDGRPGDDEAWALMPKTEQEAGLVTQEMSEAWGIAVLLENEMARRMAFKETHRNRVREARAQGRPVKWSVSAGWNKASTESVAIEGVQRGLVGVEQAKEFVPPERHHLLLEAATAAKQLTGGR
jgi:hypothetical protein